MSHLTLGPGNCPIGDPCGTSGQRALGPHAHGPQPNEGRPEGTEGARPWPLAGGRVQGAGGDLPGTTGKPQSWLWAAAGVPACLSAPHAQRQGPTVWAGGGSWPCPRAASAPRTLLPALQLSAAQGGWGCRRTPRAEDSVRMGPHKAPLCWPAHSTWEALRTWGQGGRRYPQVCCRDPSPKNKSEHSDPP